MQVDDAIARGARVICGGAALEVPGNWFPATVLADCTPEMLVMTQETYKNYEDFFYKYRKFIYTFNNSKISRKNNKLSGGCKLYEAIFL